MSGYDKILNVSSLNLYIVAFLTFRKKKAYKKVTISSLDIQAARFNEFPYVLHVLLFWYFQYSQTVIRKTDLLNTKRASFPLCENNLKRFGSQVVGIDFLKT